MQAGHGAELQLDMGLSSAFDFSGQYAGAIVPGEPVRQPGLSHDGAAPWIDRAVSLARKSFKKVCVRGDTDFALTAHVDRCTADGVGFAFGLDAMPNLVHVAENPPAESQRADCGGKTVPEHKA